MLAELFACSHIADKGLPVSAHGEDTFLVSFVFGATVPRLLQQTPQYFIYHIKKSLQDSFEQEELPLRDCNTANMRTSTQQWSHDLPKLLRCCVVAMQIFGMIEFEYHTCSCDVQSVVDLLRTGGPTIW